MHKILWIKSTILTLLASITIEIGALLYQSWTGEHHVLMPWTFFTLWGAGALGVIAWKASQLNVPPHEFFGVAFGGALVSAIAGLFIPQLIPSHYFGVCSRPTLTTHDTGYGEAYDYPRYQGCLYHEDSPDLESAFKEARDSNEQVGTHGFIYWQTGLAAGFYPDQESVSDFAHPFSFGEYLELFLTVGPVALLESAMLGVVRNFPVLMLFVIGVYAVTGQHGWERTPPSRCSYS